MSVVRPAIIESAFSEPAPGWIRGFRMAEPVIISYARGLLKEFPGVPEGIIDVIPDSPAHDAGLAVGEVVQGIDEVAVGDFVAFRNRISTYEPGQTAARRPAAARAPATCAAR